MELNNRPRRRLHMAVCPKVSMETVTSTAAAGHEGQQPLGAQLAAGPTRQTGRSSLRPSNTEDSGRILQGQIADFLLVEIVGHHASMAPRRPHKRRSPPRQEHATMRQMLVGELPWLRYSMTEAGTSPRLPQARSMRQRARHRVTSRKQPAESSRHAS